MTERAFNRGKLCVAPGCEAPRYARGLCQPCYRRDYALRNKEAVSERGKAYYRANREKWAARHATPERVAYMREYRRKNRETLAEKRRAWGKLHWREGYLRNKFGITVAEYISRERQQGGLCAICHGPEKSPDGRRLAVDHSHTTGAVRGLLCSRCNLQLGWLETNADLVDAMFRYLAEHEESAGV